MLAGILILSGGILILNPKAAQASSFDDSEVKHITYPAWFKKTPFYELDHDLLQARESGKQGLMILFTTEGCSYCHLFIEKSLADPEIAAMVQRHFDSVGLEIFDDTDLTDPGGTNMPTKEFASRDGVQFSPTLLFYGKDGERLLRLTGYQSPARFKKALDYVTGEHYKTVSFADYLKQLAENEIPEKTTARLIDDPLFSKPFYLLQRNRFAAIQPLLVLFEKAGCVECENFHNEVLGVKEVRAALGRFEVVRLDATDNKMLLVAPDGSRLTPAVWFEKTGFSRLPALLFFDERGNEVLKTDTLVLRQRMMNSVNFVLEKAYKKGWTYQRFARSKAIERRQKKQE
jgi:thioredoxin-related protein